MNKLYIGDNEAGNGNPPPKRQQVPVEKDPVDTPVVPAESK